MPPFALFFAVVTTAFWISGMSQGPGPDPRWIEYVGLSVIALPSIGVALWGATRWHINLTDQGVTVVKWRGSTTVPWEQIDDVTADYWGLRIQSSTGATATARMFGRPKWRDFGLPWPSTAENLAGHLKRLAAEDRTA